MVSSLRSPATSDTRYFLGAMPPLTGLCSTLSASTHGSRRCEKIAALPPDVRKGSAFPSTRLNIKAFRLGRLPESHRLSAHQEVQPQQPVTAIFSHLLSPWARVCRPSRASPTRIRYRTYETVDLGPVTSRDFARRRSGCRSGLDAGLDQRFPSGHPAGAGEVDATVNGPD